MSIKANSQKSTLGTIQYCEGKEKSEVLDSHLCSAESTHDLARQFKVFQDLNSNCRNNTIHHIISPKALDGSKIPNEVMVDYVKDYMKEMKLENNQYKVWRHHDTKNDHIHVAQNRIGSDGKAYNDSLISQKAQDVEEKLAEKYGFVNVRTVRDFNLEMSKDLRTQIKDKHLAVMQHRPKDFNQYKDLMKSSGVEIVPYITKKNTLQGFRMEFQGNSFKASEIDKKISLNTLATTKETQRTNHNPEFIQAEEKKKELVLEKDKEQKKSRELTPSTTRTNEEEKTKIIEIEQPKKQSRGFGR